MKMFMSACVNNGGVYDISVVCDKKKEYTFTLTSEYLVRVVRQYIRCGWYGRAMKLLKEKNKKI
jgi:hypothetical protein